MESFVLRDVEGEWFSELYSLNLPRDAIFVSLCGVA